MYQISEGLQLCESNISFQIPSDHTSHSLLTILWPLQMDEIYVGDFHQFFKVFRQVRQ